MAEKSFGLKGKDDKAEEETEAEVGTSAEQEKLLADNTANTDGSGIMKGDVTGDDDQGKTSFFTHVKDQKYDDESAIDKVDGKDAKEQVLPDHSDMEKKEENEQKVSWKKEHMLEK